MKAKGLGGSLKNQLSGLKSSGLLDIMGGTDVDEPEETESAPEGLAKESIPLPLEPALVTPPPSPNIAEPDVVSAEAANTRPTISEAPGEMEVHLGGARKRSTGTYTAPYVTRDGKEMVKWQLTMPVEFVSAIRQYAAEMGLHFDLKKWVCEVLTREMQRKGEK